MLFGSCWFFVRSCEISPWHPLPDHFSMSRTLWKNASDGWWKSTSGGGRTSLGCLNPRHSGSKGRGNICVVWFCNPYRTYTNGCCINKRALSGLCPVKSMMAFSVLSQAIACQWPQCLNVITISTRGSSIHWCFVRGKEQTHVALLSLSFLSYNSQTCSNLSLPYICRLWLQPFILSNLCLYTVLTFWYPGQETAAPHILSHNKQREAQMRPFHLKPSQETFLQTLTTANYCRL